MVPLPRRSLVIVEGAARYDWHHAIRRQDVHARRIAVTLRCATFTIISALSEIVLVTRVHTCSSFRYLNTTVVVVVVVVVVAE